MAANNWKDEEVLQLILLWQEDGIKGQSKTSMSSNYLQKYGNNEQENNAKLG